MDISKDEETGFVDQLATNIADVEKLVGKNYTLGGSPNVLLVSKQKETIFSADKADEHALSPKKLYAHHNLSTARLVPPKTSVDATIRTIDRVLAADLTPHDVHLLLVYLSDRYPPERFFTTDELIQGVGHE